MPEYMLLLLTHVFALDVESPAVFIRHRWDWDVSRRYLRMTALYNARAWTRIARQIVDQKGVAQHLVPHRPHSSWAVSRDRHHFSPGLGLIPHRSVLAVSISLKDKPSRSFSRSWKCSGNISRVSATTDRGPFEVVIALIEGGFSISSFPPLWWRSLYAILAQVLLLRAGMWLW